MPKKLAVTIAGAVSLGSYEAGVLWELLDAIRQHNLNPATAPDDKIVIDVLTGASAGGMTAVILAQKLLYSAAEFKGPYDNPLYNCWVKRISLAGLNNTQPDEDPLISIFSSDLIETISHEQLTSRWDAAPPPPAVRHAAVSGGLSLGLALTNLNGLPYTYPVTPGGAFTYIDSVDQMTRLINPVPCDNVAFWEPLRQGAVACGAFPIAFRPQALVRSKAADAADYDSPNLAWPGDPTTFTYSDGGILQNQPLGIAKNLVDPIDQHLQEKRYYLFVSPHAKDPASTAFAAADANYLSMIKRLVGVSAGQSGFQDWITAKGVNERICLLDERAAGLKDAILAGQVTVDALQTVASQLLPLFFPDGQHLPPGADQPETLAQARERIALQYRTEIAALQAVPKGPDGFRDSILAFESAAGLGARDTMIIYGIIAKDSDLASADLQAFLGFFDQKYRDHDYDVGRRNAQTILTDPALANDGQMGPLNFQPGPLRAIDQSLDGSQVHHLSPADIQQFRTGLRRRVNQMLHQLKWGVFAEPFIDGIVDQLVDHLTAPPKADPADPLGLNG